MDASLLMSPDYMQPLIPSELSYLVEEVFDRDNISFLRHSAAKKCSQWHKTSGISSGAQQSLSRPLSLKSSYSFSPHSSQVVTSPMGSTNSYALARITDHTHREEHLAQVRLSKWASELQRSLQNERTRFEALARGERAVWLTEKLGECVRDGTLLAISDGLPDNMTLSAGPLVRRESASRGVSREVADDYHDPLGLLQLNSEMKRRGWTAIRIVGGFGIIGGLAYWVSKSWNAQSEESEWAVRWGMLWMDW